MYRSFLLLVVLLFLSPLNQLHAQAGSKTVPGSIEPIPEAKSFYDEGIERLKMGQVSEAVERFQQALKIDPEYADAYSELGRAYFKLRQWNNAVGPLRRAMALKAKERERQDALRKTPPPVNEPRVIPTSPASKPKAPSADTKPPGLVAVKTIPREQPATPPSSVAKQPPNLNKPLPAPRLGTQATFDLKPPPRTEVSAQSNINSELLQTDPPPEVPRKADPEPADVQVAMNVQPVPLETKTVSAATLNSSTSEIALTNIYRVGAKDVLEVRLQNSQPQQTTVFTVTQSGLLEHPNLSTPLPVAGLTVDEIRTKIEADLKDHVQMENPKVSVEVLEHASHSLVVEGLVTHPGTKLLKSEAVPLAIILAEAHPLPEAAKVTVVRNETQILETDLRHTTDIGFMVYPGDVVTLHPHVNEFLYVGGKVKSPGEKIYRIGLTLTQAILAAGGASNSNVAEITRENGEQARFDLNDIQSGKIADPLLKPRDRITLH